MKTLFSSLAITVVVLSCNNSQQEKNSGITRDFIPGKYVRHVSHSAGEEWDTLSISRFSDIGNDYIIQRGWSYQRIKDGVKQPIDYTVEKRKAIYDDQKMVLTEVKSGRVISFAPEKNVLLSGTVEYKKQKE